MLKPTFHIDFSCVIRKSELYNYKNFGNNLDEFYYLKLFKTNNIIKDKYNLEFIIKELCKKKSNKKFLDYSKYLKSLFFENNSLTKLKL